ncbi:Cupredoxin [Gongronella butleri]|nr:Cupredoxin [Gongronella butleri]
MFVVFLALLLAWHALAFIDDYDMLYGELQHRFSGKERTYYVAIDEVLWDYAPDAWDQVHDTPLDVSPSKEWTTSSSTSIGRKYYKAQYRQYLDASYTQLTPVPAWQGGMGPILRGEVGDTLVIHVWNRAQHNFSMHPHASRGVFYDFDMEGAVYKGSDAHGAIEPNARYTYRWQLHPRAGPGPADGRSLVWGYHSHVTEFDIYAGLYGAILVYRPGSMDSEGMENQQEIVTTVFASDENLSPYLSKTMEDDDGVAGHLDVAAIERMDGDPTPFYLSNVKQMVNGLMMARPRSLVLRQGQSVDWHVLAWGSFIDIVDVAWENGVVEHNGRVVQHLSLLPAIFRTVTITPDQAGFWKFGALGQPAGDQGMLWLYQVV